MSTELPQPEAAITPSVTASAAPPDRAGGASPHWLRLVIQRQVMARCSDLLDEWRLLRAIRRAGHGRQRRSWRQLASAAAGLMLMLGGLVRGLDSTWLVQAATIPFTGHVIDGAFNGAISLTDADLDGDGDLDVVGAAYTGNDVAWWESDGTPANGGWVTHTIDAAVSGAIDVATADLDGDGDLDVIGAAKLSGGSVVWWANDGTPQDGGWTTHTIDVASLIEATSAADLDGDGDLDVLGAVAGAADITWWENDGTPANGGWITHTISGTFAGGASVTPADLDSDGDLDVVSAGFSADSVTWWESDGTPANGGWTTHTIDAAFDGAFGTAAADVDGDGDLDVLGAALNINSITWWENDGTPANGGWITHTIDGAFTGAARVGAADLDGDGDVDVFGAALIAGSIRWWENDGSPANGGWVTHTITGSFAGAKGVAAADLDGDGDLDVLGAALSADTIAWWENRTIHRNALLGGTIPFTHTIDANFDGPFSVTYADLDGDGDLDALGAGFYADDITWWENDGTPANGGWITHTIDGVFDGGIQVAAADLDRDGDLDVLGAGFLAGDTTWWENDGTPANGGWITHTIEDNAAATAIAVASTDLDGDGDLDVLGANLVYDRIVWWENDGTPANGGWITHTIVIGFDGARSVAMIDLDGDGDVDVVGAAFLDGDITWWESDGTPANGGWVTHTISGAFTTAYALTVADLDGDGDVDVLGVNQAANTVAWWESDGSPANGGWTTHTIDGAFNGAAGVAAADLDGDGDLDVLGAANVADNITWWENDGTPADGGWTTHTIYTNFDGAMSVAAADLDKDGDLDVLGAARDADDITWWQNKGGQFTLPTTGTAPASMSPAGSDDFLKIDFTHNGRTGDNDEELATLHLRFEDTTGAADPLTTAEANAIVQDLKIYRDDGNGIYEAGSDTLVTTVRTLALNGSGDQIVTFTDADANVQLPQATGTRTYYVVLDLTATYPGDPARNGVTKIRVTHVTEAGSTAEDESTTCLWALPTC